MRHLSTPVAPLNMPPITLVTEPPKPLFSLVQTVEEPKPKPIKYVVRAGDTLEKIASDHHVTVQRLFDKNKDIDHPDLINVGEVIVVPLKDEKLEARKIPDIISNAFQRSDRLGQNSPRSGGYSSSGNLYDFHSCTWHVKQMRPDLPNNLGNAYSWVSRAAAQGIPTGKTPKAGAVGQQGGHVVFIEKVKGNQVYLSERNYDWNGSYRERWADASDFVYIY